MSQPPPKNALLYDGECPVCRNYAARVRVQDAAGGLELMSAREPGALLEKATERGWDLDQGMVLKLDEELYYGEEAIHRLALISTRSGLFNKINYRLFRSAAISRLAYPVLKMGRNILLSILGVSRIGNLPGLNTNSSIVHMEALQIVAFLVLSITLFAYFRDLIDQATVFTTLLVPVLIGVAGVGIKSTELPRAYNLLLFSTAFISSFYVLAAYPSLPVSQAEEMPASSWLFLQYGAYGVAILGLLSYWRPALATFPLTYILWRKRLLAETFNFKIADTDFLAVLEAGLFLLCSLVVYRVLTWCLKDSLKPERKQRWLILAVLVAVATHFGNYFYSAVDKMQLDDNPFAWVLYNNTHNIVLASDLSSLVPLSFSDQSSWLLHQVVSRIVPLINWGTLALQLFSLIGLWRLRWAIVITLFYDLTHIAIFFITGIFFWKWILLNFAIVAALIALRDYRISWREGVFFSLCTLFAPIFFTTMRLGWWDTPEFNRAYFAAQTEDGQQYEVPSNYFLSGSISVAQQKRLGKPHRGHYRRGALGASEGHRDLQLLKNNTCQGKLGSESRVRRRAYDRLLDYVRLHHRFILEQVNDRGIVYYDYYPHHIWSNPARFEEFHALDKKRITSYTFHLESGCMGYVDGRPTYEVKLKGEYLLPL